MPARTRNEKVVKAVEGKLGKAKRPARGRTVARAAVSGLLRPEELEARQERIGEKRRTGGPDLDAAPKRGRGTGPAKVPATGCADPKR